MMVPMLALCLVSWLFDSWMSGRAAVAPVFCGHLGKSDTRCSREISTISGSDSFSYARYWGESCMYSLLDLFLMSTHSL